MLPLVPKPNHRGERKKDKQEVNNYRQLHGMKTQTAGFAKRFAAGNFNANLVSAVQSLPRVCGDEMARSVASTNEHSCALHSRSAHVSAASSFQLGAGNLRVHFFAVVHEDTSHKWRKHIPPCYQEMKWQAVVEEVQQRMWLQLVSQNPVFHQGIASNSLLSGRNHAAMHTKVSRCP